MSINAQTIITEACSDFNVSLPGQVLSSDVLAIGLKTLNQMIDQWAFDRLFLLYGVAPGTVLSAFPDLTTSYPLAPGSEKALRKNLAAELAPVLLPYFKVPEPALQKLESEAMATKAALWGVGVA